MHIKEFISQLKKPCATSTNVSSRVGELFRRKLFRQNVKFSLAQVKLGMTLLEPPLFPQTDNSCEASREQLRARWTMIP